jgi:hypothetical protein
VHADCVPLGHCAQQRQSLGVRQEFRLGQRWPKVQLALQSFQLEDPSFHPYNSKFDLHVYKRPGGDFSPTASATTSVSGVAMVAGCNVLMHAVLARTGTLLG